MERWLSGRKRLPAKKLYWDTGIMGSNPILSAIKNQSVINVVKHKDYFNLCRMRTHDIMGLKHEADVMQVHLQSQTCCSAKCERSLRSKRGQSHPLRHQLNNNR